MALVVKDRVNMLAESAEGFSPQTIAAMIGSNVSDVIDVLTRPAAAPADPFAPAAGVALTNAPTTFAPSGAGIPLTAKLRASAATTDPSLIAGTGKGYGPPPSAPTPTAGAAGALTGVFRYAYTETSADGGETTLSPSAPVTLAAQKANITLPLPRRGTGSRILYRTKAGGSVFFRVAETQRVNSDGGDFFSTLWVDNVADAALLTTQPPSADQSQQWTLRVIDDLPIFAISPDANAAADLGLLCADPANPQSWSIDSYGTVTARGQTSFKAITSGGPVGSDGSALVVGYIDLTVPSDTAAARTIPTVFRLAPQGHLQLTPAADQTVLAVTQVAAATGHLFTSQLAGDTQSRLIIDANGTTTGFTFGPGTSAADITLKRFKPASAPQLAVAGILTASGFVGVGNAFATPADPNATLDVKVTGTTLATFSVGNATNGGFKAANQSTGEANLGNAGAATVITLGNHLTNWNAVGFLGATAVARQAVTGALSTVTDAAAKAVLTSILTALTNYGLATNSTT